MKRFIEWLKLVFWLRQPSPEESVYQLRWASRRLQCYDSTVADNLAIMAKAEEEKLGREKQS